jgi:hypothetical protein
LPHLFLNAGVVLHPNICLRLLCRRLCRRHALPVKDQATCSRSARRISRTCAVAFGAKQNGLVRVALPTLHVQHCTGKLVRWPCTVVVRTPCPYDAETQLVLVRHAQKKLHFRSFSLGHSHSAHVRIVFWFPFVFSSCRQLQIMVHTATGADAAAHSVGDMAAPSVLVLVGTSHCRENVLGRATDAASAWHSDSGHVRRTSRTSPFAGRGAGTRLRARDHYS